MRDMNTAYQHRRDISFRSERRLEKVGAWIGMVSFSIAGTLVILGAFFLCFYALPIAFGY